MAPSNPGPCTDLPGDVSQLPEEVVGGVVVSTLGLDGLHDDPGHRPLLFPIFHDQILHLDSTAGSDSGSWGLLTAPTDGHVGSHASPLEVMLKMRLCALPVKTAIPTQSHACGWGCVLLRTGPVPAEYRLLTWSKLFNFLKPHFPICAMGTLTESIVVTVILLSVGEPFLYRIWDENLIKN